MELGLFYSIDSAKTITVKVPDNGAWSDIIGDSPYNETGAPYTVNWGNGFRGGGWKNNKFATNDSHYINSYINLKVEAQ
jgi:hypothetical protein